MFGDSNATAGVKKWPWAAATVKVHDKGSPMTSTTRRGAFAALGGAAVSASAPAPRPIQSPPADETYRLPLTAVVPFRSAINGVDYSLYVRPPVDYDPDGDERHPVIVTLDADYSFAVAAPHLEHLAARMNQGPRAILVSIAYTGVYPDGYGYRMNRSRDYTPVFSPDRGYGPEFQAKSGGGPDFLRVILTEALPIVAARWRADPVDHTLVGHSFGGLFAAWVLQTHPEAFLRYLMVSPSLWYADRLLLEREPALSGTRLGRRTYAWLGVGEWEEQPQTGGHMVTEMQEFAARLAARGDPNLIVKSRVFEDETHASIFPAAFSTGIRHLFGSMAST